MTCRSWSDWSPVLTYPSPCSPPSTGTVRYRLPLGPPTSCELPDPLLAITNVPLSLAFFHCQNVLDLSLPLWDRFSLSETDWPSLCDTMSLYHCWPFFPFYFIGRLFPKGCGLCNPPSLPSKTSFLTERIPMDVPQCLLSILTVCVRMAPILYNSWPLYIALSLSLLECPQTLLTLSGLCIPTWLTITVWRSPRGFQACLSLFFN